MYVHSMKTASDTGETIASPAPEVISRRRHYGAFYGLDPLPQAFGLVVGNCQAESLRIVLDGPERPTLRVPPVHEMTVEDAELLHGLVARAEFVVAQPIRDDYRGLPLGTRQLGESARRGIPVITVPSVRFAGLHPFQVAMRVPGVDEDPPIVAYHDVRTLSVAAGLPVADRLDAEGVRRIAEASVAELRRREDSIDVPVSDLLQPVAEGLMRTVNHPGNDLFLPLAARVLDKLGGGDPTDPGRPLLAAVQAPLEAWVVDAWQLDTERRAHWIVGGEPVDPDEVRDAHREWYARHPQFVTGAAERLGDLLAVWRAA